MRPQVAFSPAEDRKGQTACRRIVSRTSFLAAANCSSVLCTVSFNFLTSTSNSVCVRTSLMVSIGSPRVVSSMSSFCIIWAFSPAASCRSNSACFATLRRWRFSSVYASVRSSKTVFHRENSGAEMMILPVCGVNPHRPPHSLLPLSLPVHRGI